MTRRLLVLNGLAIIGAVIHHAIHWGLTAMFFWTDRYRPVSVPNFDQLGSATYWMLRGVDLIVILAIPAFLFVSGFFIAITAKRDRIELGWKTVFNRIKKLIPPYLIWTLLIIFAKFLLGERFTTGEIIKLVVTGGAAVPFYYVPLLIQLYILSPVIVPWISKRWKLLLGIFFAFQIVTSISVYMSYLDWNVPSVSGLLRLFRDWHLLDDAFWFLLGIVGGIYLTSFKQWLASVKGWLIAGIGTTFIISMVEWELARRLSGGEWVSPSITIMGKIFSTLLLLLIIAFEDTKYPLSSQLNYIGSKSFGIFLIHIPVLEYLARAIYHWAPSFLAYVIPFLLLISVAGILIPLLIMDIVNKSPARSLYGYLFG